MPIYWFGNNPSKARQYNQNLMCVKEGKDKVRLLQLWEGNEPVEID